MSGDVISHGDRNVALIRRGALYWVSVRGKKQAAVGCVGPGFAGAAEQTEWLAGLLKRQGDVGPDRLPAAHQSLLSKRLEHRE